VTRIDLFASTYLLSYAVACSNLPDRPEPPDMAPLVDAYANPTAELDQTVADELATDLRARVDLAGALDNLSSLIDEVLAPSLEQEEESRGGVAPRGEPGNSSVVLEGDGFARIEHVCGGWDAAPTVDEDENGRLALTATFTEGGLDPVIWGEAERCKRLFASHQVLVDGAVNLWIGENLSVDGFGDSAILFQLVAALEVDGEPWASSDFDIEVCPTGAADCEPGSIAINIAAGGGHLVFYLAPDRATGGFRAANGNWPCSFEGSDAVCTSGDESVSLTGILP
jgi:hypothetical protein